LRAHHAHLGSEDDLARRLRPADEVALGHVASQLGKQVEGGPVLNALGHDPQAHGVAELDRRAHQVALPVAVAPQQARQEHPVELELSHRKAAEVGQRSDAGTEVVDRYQHAQTLQRCNHLATGVQIADDRRLGQLQHQVLGRKVVVLEVGSDHLHEARG
jgi:hypothetical protein